MLLSSFVSNVNSGIQHIADLGAYDHMLYLLALSAGFMWKDWKRVAWLATAFTIGHSVTLIVAGLDIFRMKSAIIEFLIPVTIVLTAAWNLIFSKAGKEKWPYIIAVIFGFVHGMGFSSFFRMMSDESNIVINLLAFNLGVEIGQLLIISVILTLAWVFCGLFKISQRAWRIIISTVAICIAGLLIHQNWLW